MMMQHLAEVCYKTLVNPYRLFYFCFLMPGKRNLLFVFLLFWVHARAQDSDRLLALKLQSINGTGFSFSELKNNKASIILFLSPDCPMCQNYTLTIKQMEEQYEKAGIHFYGIFPGTWYSVEEIIRFKKEYQLNINMLLDKDKQLTHLLKATITPEAVVINHDGKILYQGRIDNWMYTAGKKRLVITKHELKDALEAIVNNRTISVSKTDPVGCLIE
jgi:peroxiredoxin